MKVPIVGMGVMNAKDPEIIKQSSVVLKNSHVAITIYDSHQTPGEANGLQIVGEARIVKLSEIPHAALTIYKKRFREKALSEIQKYLDPKRYHEMADFRLVKIIPKKFYILDPKLTVKFGKDMRVEVKL